MTTTTPSHALPQRRRRGAGPAHLSLMLPAAVVLIPFLAIIVLRGLYTALHGENLMQPGSAQDFVGLDNFLRAVHDPTLRASLLVTVIYVVVGVSIEMVLGVAIALCMRTAFPGKGIARALVLIPMVLTPVVAGLTWRLLMDPTSGTVNYFLGSLGLGTGHAFLSDPHTSLGAVILVEIWQNTPYVIIIALAGLESLDPAPFEAAQVDGAGRWSTIWHITLPMLRPVLAIIVLLRVIEAVKTFALVQTMTKGGPGTSSLAVSNYVYRVGFELFDIGYSSALAIIVSVALMILIFPVARRLMGFGKKEGR